jgi:cysteine desulfurase
MGRFTKDADIDDAVVSIVKAVRKLRELSPLYDMHNEGIDLSKVEWGHH